MFLFRTQSYITLLDILQCKVSSTLCNIQEFLYFLKLKHILLKQKIPKGSVELQSPQWVFQTWAHFFQILSKNEDFSEISLN